MTSMRGTAARVIGGLTMAVVLGAVGFLAAGPLDLGLAGTNATVSLHKTKLGPILVSSKGRTLYLFEKDRNGRSSCTGTCATYWPPYVDRTRPTAGAGVKVGLLGTTRRSDGRRQVTYGKHPLYTFALDTRAGQTTGEGKLAFGAKWYAVAAKGAPVVAAAPPTTTTVPTTDQTTTYRCPYPPC